MKKILYPVAIGLTILFFSSCDGNNGLPHVSPSERGTVTDNDGNVYGWVRIGDQMWTTSNAKNGTSLADAEYYNNFSWEYVLGSDSAIEDYEENYLPKYGNPMTLEDAVASAPEGWRLPTDEDWQKLERTLGMKDTANKGFRGDGVAYALTNKESGTELGLDFGGGCFPMKVYGWIEINLDYVGEHAYYWTSTIDDTYQEDYPMAYYRRVTVNYGKVSRACMRSDSYLSVRWVKDVK
ncbi:MAG: fibrobacter succinogenes major paralogous domain-containing protein [Muribaculaceae bacterium]|nr:fibrobacter succinogenes major paralogous domain-containing protein [Muribaculaceae bacterium]